MSVSEVTELYQVKNYLVDQKERILLLINEGFCEEATVLLDFVAPLWIAIGYGYKVKEIRGLLK
jgi:hypothetical protein